MSKLDKYRFCHIPKTGGITISDMIYNHSIYHRVCERTNDDTFLFTFVRNPYSRCLSAFYYLKNGGINDEDKKDSIKYIGDSTFEDFVSNKLLCASQEQQHFRPQHYWIPNGADFIGRYEYFIEDINRLSTIIQMKSTRIPHKNKTIYNRSYMIPNHTKDIIYTIYKQDFELFNYQK